MKVYDLLCNRGHQFEGWFAAEKDYEQQKEQGLLACPTCGSQETSKMLSAPRLQRKSNQKSRAAEKGALSPQIETSQPSSQNSPASVSVQSKIESEILNYLVKNTEDVGSNFAEEARKMHYGEAQERNIRGQTTAEEAQELKEEGIDVVQLPFSPPPKRSLQ